MSDLETVRYPSGAKEFRLRNEPIEVGDSHERSGETWVVEDVDKTEQAKTKVTLRTATTGDVTEKP